ncbi:MAG: PDDEXK nuclease domain-containing protein, partial [Promicromonosporaceae bacterium]|nr:PDDEXK nuclease domain-containing protein [Promicromonosporaceae bacterium]
MNDLDKQATTNGVTPEGYAEWVADLKQRVRLTQFRAARAANTEVLHLYWSIGRDILDRQQRLGWGGKVIDRLAIDLKLEFPDQRGWSRSNLHYMRKFAEAWPGTEGFVPQAVGQLPWGHVRVLLDRLSRQSDRKWYAERAVAEGWSRNVLELCINSGLKERDSAAITNFAGTLEPPDSDLAQQITKDPYVFEHLALVSRVEERTVEQALMDRLQATLTEFGRGMAFVGRQVRLSVTDSKGATDEVVADLLLFHIPQRRYIVVELKT